MSYVHLFTRIPWRHVIGFAPEIIEVAQKVYGNVKKTLGLKRSAFTRDAAKAEPLTDLDRRVERLESNEVQQAELVRNMALQAGSSLTPCASFPRGCC